MNVKKGSAAAHIVMGLLAIYFLLPFWWLLVAATKNNDGLFQSASLWFADSPSVRAREKLAITPGLRARISLASSRPYPPDRATTRSTFGCSTRSA